MSLQKYLISKTFFTQAAIAFGIVIGLMLLLLQYIEFSTNHGEEIKVPDLSKLKLPSGPTMVKLRWVVSAQPKEVAVIMFTVKVPFGYTVAAELPVAVTPLPRFQMVASGLLLTLVLVNCMFCG